MLCAIFVVLTDCSSDPGPGDHGRTPTSSPTQVTIAPTSANALEDGSDGEVVATSPGDVDGAQALWFGADREGAAYGEIIVPGPAADPGSMGQLTSDVQPVLMSPDDPDDTCHELGDPDADDR